MVRGKVTTFSRSPYEFWNFCGWIQYITKKNQIFVFPLKKPEGAVEPWVGKRCHNIGTYVIRDFSFSGFSKVCFTDLEDNLDL